TAPSRASFRIRGQLERHPLLRPSNAVPRELHPPPRAAPLVRLGKRCRMVLFRGFGEGGRVSSQRSAISDQRSAVSGQQSAVSNQQSAVSSQQSAVSSQQSAVSFWRSSGRQWRWIKCVSDLRFSGKVLRSLLKA